MMFKVNSLVLKSYAKINLSLRILGKRADGYHNVDMVFLPIELHDVIEINHVNNSPDTFITCDDISLSNQRQNLCMKALEALRKEYGFKDQFTIHIHKEIPFAAGLGGGSSNAATVLSGISRMLNLKTTPEVMNRIALSIGADVPYFFFLKPAHVTGIGETIAPIAVKSSYFCLIVKPHQGLHTKDVYLASDQFKHEVPNQNEALIKALSVGDDATIASTMENDLAKVAVSMLPDIGVVIDKLKKDGFPLSAMTGSGSACFALSHNFKALKEEARYFQNKGLIVNLTKTL